MGKDKVKITIETEGSEPIIHKAMYYVVVSDNDGIDSLTMSAPRQFMSYAAHRIENEIFKTMNKTIIED